jgi:hypothetical protein
MSQESTILASAINLAAPGATVLLPASDLAAILAEVRSLEDRVQSLEDRRDRDYERFSGDICDHGKRLKALEVLEVGPAQRDRRDVLKALLVANNGKMLAKEARQRMRIDKSLFSRLLATMKDCIEVRPFHADKRNYLLILRSENG